MTTSSNESLSFAEKQKLLCGYTREISDQSILPEIQRICGRFYDDDPESVFKITKAHGNSESGYFGIYDAINRYTCKNVTMHVFCEYLYQQDQVNALEEYKNNLKASKASKSPYIINFMEIWATGDVTWFIFEGYSDIGSIHRIISPTMCNIPLNELQIKVIIKQALLGMKSLENIGIRFKNIKADNIYLTKSGQCKIDIFGMNELPFHKGNSVIPPPYWMSPEQVSAIVVANMKSVVWSLGITAIEIAQNGHPPGYDMNPMRFLITMPQNPPQYELGKNNDGGDWSDQFKSFVALCLKRDPYNRTNVDPDHRPTIDQLLQHEWIKNVKITNGYHNLNEIAIKASNESV